MRIDNYTAALTLTVSWLALCQVLSGQEGRRDFCSGADCVPDSLEIVFRPNRASTLVLDDFVAGQQVRGQVETDTRTSLIRGWSFGVTHDPSFLRLLEDELNTDGTVADPSSPGTAVVPPAFEAIQVVEGGFTVGQVLSFIDSSASLATGQRNVILNFAYAVDADPGASGTRIAFSSGEIPPPPAQPVVINFTVGAESQSRAPQVLVDGIVRTQPPTGDCRKWALYFGPEATEEPWNAAGSDLLPITMRNELPVRSFQCGIRAESRAEGGYALSFSSELGVDGDRTISHLITDSEFASRGPRTPNTSITGLPPVGVLRGRATEEFHGSDFLLVNLRPAVGGEGLTIAYVADETAGPDRLIPATEPEGSPCPVNEVLILELGEPVESSSFLLGNVNGDLEVNLSDAVFGLNHLFSGRPEPPCFVAADANSDGDVNLTDMVFLLNHLFLGGQAPAAPFPGCDTAPIAECESSHPVCDDASP